MSRPIRIHVLATRRFTVMAVACLFAGSAGCGTTRWSDSKRTATEQLLVSDAIERAVMKIDMRPLAGRRVFLQTQMLSSVNDVDYLSSTLRQHILGSGAVIAEKIDDAEIVVEARAGAVGTDRNDLLLGVPATSLSFAGTGATLPELALAKRTDQRAVAKVSVFAYHRHTGTPVWQSGAEHVASHARDRWFLGAGPFQDGRIHERMEFAGERIRAPWRQGIPENEELVQTFNLRESRTFATAASSGLEENLRANVADERAKDLPPVR